MDVRSTEPMTDILQNGKNKTITIKSCNRHAHSSRQLPQMISVV